MGQVAEVIAGQQQSLDAFFGAGHAPYEVALTRAGLHTLRLFVRRRRQRVPYYGPLLSPGQSALTRMAQPQHTILASTSKVAQSSNNFQRRAIG